MEKGYPPGYVDNLNTEINQLCQTLRSNNEQIQIMRETITELHNANARHIRFNETLTSPERKSVIIKTLLANAQCMKATAFPLELNDEVDLDLRLLRKDINDLIDKLKSF